MKVEEVETLEWYLIDGSPAFVLESSKPEKDEFHVTNHDNQYWIVKAEDLEPWE